jgi:ribosome biogenesis SPOUT family RNA methylase Rps3
MWSRSAAYLGALQLACDTSIRAARLVVERQPFDAVISKSDPDNE